MDHSFFFRFFPSFLSQSQKSGILLASGLIILGFSDALLPFVSDDVGLGQFHFIRSALSLFGVFWLARQTSMSIMPKSWAAVVMRSLFIIIAMMLFFSVLSFCLLQLLAQVCLHHHFCLGHLDVGVWCSARMAQV